MRIDFHTHGKLARELPFSPEYLEWLFSEARAAGLHPFYKSFTKTSLWILQCGIKVSLVKKKTVQRKIPKNR